MLEVLSEIELWLNQNEPVVLATVVHTWGSSPRGLGAKMAFTPGGKITGSVSGGCVEGQVFESGIETLKLHRPQLLRFGVSDETAFDVGLACGGTIEVFVKQLDKEIFHRLSEEIKVLKSLVLVTVVSGPESLLGKEILVTEEGNVIGQLGEGLDELAIALAQEELMKGEPTNVTIQTAEGETVRLFIDVIATPPTLVMVGGVHIAIALAALAKTLGYRTVVIDPRRAFGSQERFPHVDQLIQSWPQEAFQQIQLTRNTCVTMLTHDPKIDDPALKVVLNSPVFYAGALGSRKTNEKRLHRLMEEGLTPDQLDRLHAPIGIDLGAKNPEEIALSVMAEIVAVRRGRVK